MSDEDERTEEEITAVHAGELPRPMPDVARPASSSSLGPEGTVRLRGGGVPAGPREETVLLVTDAPGATERLRPSDSGWGTVVLPGGGLPTSVEDRTLLLAVDQPEPAAAISTTARLSVGAPEPLDAVDSASLTGILPPRADAPTAPPAWSRGSGTAPPIDAAATIPVLRKGSTAPPNEGAAIAPAKGTTEPPIEARTTTVFVAPSPATREAMPTGGSASVGPAPARVDQPLPRTGRTAIIPAPAPTLVSGANPLVGLTPTGGSSIVPRPGVGPRGRAPARGPTGAHPGLRRSDDNSRLAWGFLIGVLLTVAILAAAVALALYLLG